jgi:hypothetical protein
VECRSESPNVAGEFLRSDADREWRLGCYDSADDARRHSMSVGDALDFRWTTGRYDYATLRFTE